MPLSTCSWMQSTHRSWRTITDHANELLLQPLLYKEQITTSKQSGQTEPPHLEILCCGVPPGVQSKLGADLLWGHRQCFAVVVEGGRVVEAAHPLVTRLSEIVHGACYGCLCAGCWKCWCRADLCRVEAARRSCCARGSRRNRCG